MLVTAHSKNIPVHVVVCTRNNRTIVEETLQSIANQTFRNISCTVVDGDSRDGTLDAIRENFPWVHVVEKGEDSGPATSRNIGAVAVAGHCYVAFIDSDVRLANDWIEQQIGFMECNPKVAIACGKLIDASNPNVLCAAYGAMNRYAVAWEVGCGEDPYEYDTARRCIWTSTAAVIVRTDAMRQLGGFDEGMFAFFEDVDFGWRANLFGHQVAYNPLAAACHQAHSTLNPATMGSQITYLSWRNRLRSALVNYELPNVLRYVGAYLIMSIPVLIVRRHRKEKLAALLWNVAHINGTLARRYHVQVHRIVKDNELWPLFSPGVRGPGVGSPRRSSGRKRP